MAKSSDLKTPESKPATAQAAATAAAPAKAAKPRAKAKPAAAKPTPSTSDASVKAAAATKPAKPKKPKLVRDSFTMPKTEYAAIDALKQRAIQLGQPAKKSELLRAGIMALSALDESGLKAALARVPTLKTGRPKKSQD